MRNFERPWFIAGGWAVDLFLGEITRPHDDLEIAVFRPDQIELQKHLRGWTLRKAENAHLKIWKQDEFLNLPVHEIHCFKGDSALEVLLNERDEKHWIYRRDRRITKPLSESYVTHASGVKFLRPEIVLLYKSKNPRPKDETDFENLAPRLGANEIVWLRNALRIGDAKNAWLPKLEKL